MLVYYNSRNYHNYHDFTFNSASAPVCPLLDPQDRKYLTLARIKGPII